MPSTVIVCKGQQTVRVEHVTVQAGGKAIVGHVETPEGGDRSKSDEQPQAIAFAPGIEMPNPNPEAVIRAKRRQCRTVAAGCTAECRRALRRVTRMPSGTDATRPTQSRGVERFQG
jgi:hypothetical protein